MCAGIPVDLVVDSSYVGGSSTQDKPAPEMQGVKKCAKAVSFDLEKLLLCAKQCNAAAELGICGSHVGASYAASLPGNQRTRPEGRENFAELQISAI